MPEQVVKMKLSSTARPSSNSCASDTFVPSWRMSVTAGAWYDTVDVEMLVAGAATARSKVAAPMSEARGFIPGSSFRVGLRCRGCRNQRRWFGEALLVERAIHCNRIDGH